MAAAPLPPNALAPVAVKAEKKQVGLEVRYAAGLPTWVHGDPVRIRQLLLNLADNAVKFTEHGSVIIDSSTTRKFGGSGLGLAICRQLVDLMNGTIGVSSTVGEGSCRSPAAPARSLRVLLAEDNRINQIVAIRNLEKAGCAVDVVDNGEAAVALLRDRQYDIVFMDCQMPMMDGYEATRQIRRLPNGTSMPIVALTAHAMEGDREHCLEAGMTDYLSKPLDAADLIRVLERYGGGTPSPALAPSSVHFDASHLRLLMDHDEQAMIEVSELLIGDLPLRLTRLRDDLRAERWERVGMEAHAMRGAASNVSATRVTETARVIEAAVRAENYGVIAGHLETLSAAVEALVDALTQWANDLRSGPRRMRRDAG